MKFLLITLLLISSSMTFASCIAGSESCDDMIVNEDVVEEPASTEPDSCDLSDETDAEENAWLEDND